MDFKAVYEEHFDFVWRTLRRLGVPEHDTADAAQEVFVVVHRKLATFAGESKITTWLYGIAMRVVRDRRQLAHVRYETASASPDDDRPEGADAADDASERLHRSEGLALLERALGVMPLEQRAVFTMFECEELTVHEIADRLAIPVGTVSSRLRLARQAFYAEIERQRARESFALALRRRQVAR